MKHFAKLSLMLSLLAALVAIERVHAFSTLLAFTSNAAIKGRYASGSALSRHVLKTSEDDSSEGDAVKKSLEDKMKNWEASEEEIKASTLGGVTPGRSDAFDIGLYIAFPFMILASLAFAFFPLIMDKIDVSSVGPPPTV